MDKPRIGLLFVVFVSAMAWAQSRTVTVAPADVDQVVTGGTVQLLDDGGCALIANFAQPVAGALQPQPQPHPFGGVKCSTVRSMLQRCSYLDAQVGDGGQP